MRSTLAEEESQLLKFISRRQFIATGAASVAIPTVVSADFAPRVQKPAALRKGDLVSVVAPASGVLKAEDFVAAQKALEKLGFTVSFGPHARMVTGYLAGSDQDRLSDLIAALKDPVVKGVFCLRGGYGCARLLPLFDGLKLPVKPIIGYSDATSLLNGLFARRGWVGFHGPVATSTFNEFTASNFWSLMEGGRDLRASESNRGSIVCHVRGRAQGRLTGGNATVFCSLIGTPFLPKMDGTILLLEDIGEDSYRLDRMLTQLDQAGILAKVSAVAFGRMLPPKETDPEMPKGPSLSEVIQEKLGRNGIPVCSGLPFGHIVDKWTIPLGIRAELDAEEGSIHLLESAFATD